MAYFSIYSPVRRIGKLMILFSIMLWWTDGMRAQVNADQVITIGRNVLSMEDYMLSIQYFNLAIKAKPYLPEPYYYRGLAKLMLDDFQGAEDDCTEAIERNRFITEAYRVRGFARARLGKDSLAVADFDKGLEYNPIDKYFLFYKAASQTGMEDIDGAEQTFARLIKAYPRFDGAYSERARLYLIKKDTVSALSDIERAIELNKNEVSPYLFRASISAGRKNWDEAKTDMDRAIELMPKEADLYVNRAYLRYNSDDYFGAMSDYNYALELEPDNMAAVYNRALLRYEVHDFKRAEDDLTHVLQENSANFHARYCRGLVRLENGNNKGAVEDFNVIANQYPKFYPVYYAIAQAKQNTGDIRGAVASYQKGEELIRKYVRNPERNPLDRPVIQSGETNTEGLSRSENESEIDVMNRFNKLVTVGAEEVGDRHLSFNESIRGKVQDRNLKVETEPYYVLTNVIPAASLRISGNYFKELDALNNGEFTDISVYLTNHPSPMPEAEMSNLFSRLDSFNIEISQGKNRPVDFLIRGILSLTLRNPDSALEDFDKAIEGKEDFTVAYMARANARYDKLLAMRGGAGNSEAGQKDGMMLAGELRGISSEIISDLDIALSLDPSLVYAWFNKAEVYLQLDDLTSALNCLNEAIRINPDFGEAYYNRGIVYLRMGNKNSGLSDLSKAGELGVLPSYNLLKRMK